MTDETRERSHDVLHYEVNPLTSIFAPKSVAVIGATQREGSVGRTIMQNLMDNDFGGNIYPINLKRKKIFDLKTYRSITKIKEAVDLAIIVTPAHTVPNIIRECVSVGVQGAIIISAGFKERGEAGVALEQKILEIAKEGRMRIIGPNCLGVMNPISGLNATFATKMARKGSVGFISQSGALLTSILDWSFQENVGFSAFVSVGSMMDVGWGDLITFLGDDPSTKSIVIYMESIGDARSFLSAAREVALTKPIIVIKPGRTEAAAKAAASHTGSLTGRDEVLAAAFRRSGVLRVDTVDALFNMAEVLAKQPSPRGPRLAIVTNAGGPGVLATDALIGRGGELAELTDETIEALNQLLPSHWSHGNPIDILGDADPERYAEAIEIVSKDKNSDGYLIILTPQSMSDPSQTAREVVDKFERPAGYPYGKPVLASWMGGEDVTEGQRLLNKANIPTFDFPDTAAYVFELMRRYQKRLQSLYETPEAIKSSADLASEQEEMSNMIAQIRETGRTILTEYESKKVLSAYGISTVETRLAQTADEAVIVSNEIGYPVVLKLNSETITHKTDVGGVRLDLMTDAAVQHAFESMETAVTEKYSRSDFLGVTVQPMLNLKEGYELILGASPDPQFGPVLLFGTGGTLVEIFKDRALGLPPLTTTLARRMMERTKIFHALQGVRGRDPIDLPALEELMVRFSQLVIDQPWIREIDINPLFASEEMLIALDGRIVLYDNQTAEEDLPQLAIRPYPTQYIQPFIDKTFEQHRFRPIRPEDEPKMVAFHETLSEESVYFRYFRAFNLEQRVEHERLVRTCFVDYDRDIVLVVERVHGDQEIIAVGRLTRTKVVGVSEFAMLVSDDYQGRGIGTALLKQLLDVGKQENVQVVEAYMLATNGGMRAVSKRLGFSFKMEEGVIKATLQL